MHIALARSGEDAIHGYEAGIQSSEILASEAN
jgi:hypothetical protein